MIEAGIVSKPEGCINKNMMTPNLYVSTKKHSARKSLHQLSESLDVKYKTDINRLGAAKARLKALKKRQCIVITY